MSDILIIYLCLPLGFLAGAVFVIVEHVSGNIDLDKIFGKSNDEKLRQGNTESTIDSGGIRSDSINS